MLWMLMVILESEHFVLYTTYGTVPATESLACTSIASRRRLGRMALNQVSKREDRNCDTWCTGLEVEAETMLVERSSRKTHGDHSRWDVQDG